MAILVADPYIEDRLIAEREASGADRYDEVWEGVRMMTPMPNDEHQQIVSRFVSVLEDIVGWPGLGEVRPGVNLSGRGNDWEHDFRVPDVAVFLRSGSAENYDTHWRGAADFLIEITSPGDRTREKISFYGSLGVTELLVVDRRPWALELYRQQVGQLKLAGHCDVENGEVLYSNRVPLSFQLVAGDARPQIEVRHGESERCWLV